MNKVVNTLYRTIIVPVLEDNYSYIIACNRTNKGVAVDPVEPDVVLEAAKREHVDLVAVLTTHNHFDHAGGNMRFKALVPAAAVYGGKGDGAEGVTHEVTTGRVVSFGDVEIDSLYTPCHTSGHVCYVAHDACRSDPSSVFTGDTMFVAGCGNFNDGSPDQMYDALVNQLCALPEQTLVFVGHEYTVNNLKFAKLVEPASAAIAAKLEWALDQRRQNRPTVPSTIADEKQTNPFCRVREPAVQAYAGRTDPIEAIAQIRHLKSNTRV